MTSVSTRAVTPPPQHSHTSSTATKDPRTPSPRGNRPPWSRDHTRSRILPSQRLPPPTLFQGPLSRNASVISLSLPGETAKDHTENGRAAAAAAAAAALATSTNTNSARPPSGQPATASRYSTASLRQPPTQAAGFQAESLWAEMQQTLADVQLSAMGSSHVFGAENAKALEDLRTSQLSLAQAWAKSQTDEIVDNDLLDDHDAADNVVSAGLTTSAKEADRPGGGGGGGSNSGGGVAGAKQAEASSTAAQKSSQNLEDETQEDIRRARRRKEANDRYFQRVNQGVLDVISKLDDVASAMRKVQKKSRDLWEPTGSDSDESADTQSDSGDDLHSRSPDSHTVRGR